MQVWTYVFLAPVALIAAGVLEWASDGAVRPSAASGAASRIALNVGLRSARAEAFAQASPATPATRAPARPQTATVRQATQTKPAAKSSKEELPPLSYVCIMQGDEAVLEDKPGKCPNPKCGMPLIPVRLTSAWSSVSHPTIIQDHPGKDPLDKRDLVQITASMFWLCPGSDEHLLEPGTCANGNARQIKYERRPHGDHNPRHGGQFFMADDSWHHLEGTYPRGGPFRVFFYDDYTRPMPVKGFSGSVVLLDANDKELDSFPLSPGRITNALETRIKVAALPLRVKLKVRFDPEGKERPFDFAFADNTRDASPLPPTGTTAGGTARPSAPANSPAARPTGSRTPSAAAVGTAPPA